jgi:hypothetical protein
MEASGDICLTYLSSFGSIPKKIPNLIPSPTSGIGWRCSCVTAVEPSLPCLKDKLVLLFLPCPRPYQWRFYRRSILPPPAPCTDLGSTPLLDSLTGLAAPHESIHHASSAAAAATSWQKVINYFRYVTSVLEI